MAATITTISKEYSGGVEYGLIKVLIPTADVLTIGATPITLVAAPGAGKFIVATSMLSKMTYAGVAYATSTTLFLITDTATDQQMEESEILLSTASRIKKPKSDISSLAASDTQIIENKALTLKTSDGVNPTAGTSDLTVYLEYKVITA